MKRILRWEIPIDGQPHQLDVAGDIRAVGVSSVGLLRADVSWRVDLWTEATEGAPAVPRIFQIYGTGWEIPDSATWCGTAPRTPDGYVWHLYEHPASQEQDTHG